MTTDPSVFDSNLPVWKQGQDTPWGILRRTIAFRNLTAHLLAPSLDVLDAGGGNGRDSIPLAKIGHRVDLVDYSSKMLEDASAEARREAIESGLFTLHKAGIAAIPNLFQPGSHDVVLLHNVLSYVEDADAILDAATRSLRPSGILSLMQVNRYSEAMYSAVRDMDLDSAFALLDAKKSAARMFDNAPVRRYAADELVLLLESHGFEVIRHYGILCVTGYIFDNDLKYQPEFFGKLEQLEMAMSGRHPYNLMAKFCHLIAGKSEAVKRYRPGQPMQ